jgi:hypothetical protein
MLAIVALAGPLGYLLFFLIRPYWHRPCAESVPNNSLGRRVPVQSGDLVVSNSDQKRVSPRNILILDTPSAT